MIEAEVVWKRKRIPMSISGLHPPGFLLFHCHLTASVAANEELLGQLQPSNLHTI